MTHLDRRSKVNVFALVVFSALLMTACASTDSTDRRTASNCTASENSKSESCDTSHKPTRVQNFIINRTK